MKKKKRSKAKKSLKKLTAEERKLDATRWLRGLKSKKDILDAYSRRYSLKETDADYELLELGYHDEVQIQYYEKNGIEWEYKYDGYEGEMKVVPKGTPDWELHEFI